MDIWTMDKYLNAEFEFRIFRVKLVVLPVDNVVTPVWSPLARTGVAAAGRISGNQLTLASTHRALASRYLHSLYTPCPGCWPPAPVTLAHLHSL